MTEDAERPGAIGIAVELMVSACRRVVAAAEHGDQQSALEASASFARIESQLKADERAHAREVIRSDISAATDALEELRAAAAGTVFAAQETHELCRRITGRWGVVEAWIGRACGALRRAEHDRKHVRTLIRFVRAVRAAPSTAAEPARWSSVDLALEALESRPASASVQQADGSEVELLPTNPDLVAQIDDIIRGIGGCP